jgi:hypothetical protein
VFFSGILINDALGFCQAHTTKKKRKLLPIIEERKKKLATTIKIKE